MRVNPTRSVLPAVLFAGVLQFPVASQQAILSPGQNTTMKTAQTKKDAAKDLATIIQSRSTNSRAFNVVIHDDGSATVEMGAASSDSGTESQQFSPGTIDVTTLRRLLTEIKDVSTIPTGPCLKSVSFGTRTQISYAGKISGDLQCIRTQSSVGDQALLQASQELSRFVRDTLSQLKINARRVISKP